MAKIKNQVQEIELGKILQSESNPRKSFNHQSIEDLAASMNGPAGLLQPITLRRRKDILEGEYQEYEIVAGERRYRAARLLGWEKIQAFVREISDEEMLEVQIIENLQREDVSPIDEAHAFKTLLAKESLEWLATKIHKPKKYILDRLKLNDLHEAAAEYVEQGILPLGHAMMISKLPFADQKAAIDFCIDDDWTFGRDDDKKYCSCTISELKDHIVEKYMLDFKKVNFPLDDAELYAEAGPCSTCPKRTCNANLLFQDITDEDQCTDSACFNLKIKKHVEREKGRLKQEHGTVLMGSMEWSGRDVKVQGVSVKIQEKPSKNSIPVLISTQDGYSRNHIGKTVYIAKNAVETAKADKEEKKSSGNNSMKSYAQQQREKFLTQTWPRLQQIAAIKQPNKQIMHAWLKDKMDGYGSKNDWLAFTGVLGLNVQYDSPEKAFDNEDPEFSEMGVVFDRIIEKVPLDLLITYMHLIDRIDDDDDHDDDFENEDFSLSWKQMMDLINPQPKANGRKKKAVD
jgi:ParB/RepB/Spo0J family partition protein